MREILTFVVSILFYFYDHAFIINYQPCRELEPFCCLAPGIIDSFPLKGSFLLVTPYINQRAIKRQIPLLTEKCTGDVCT